MIPFAHLILQSGKAARSGSQVKPSEDGVKEVEGDGTVDAIAVVVQIDEGGIQAHLDRPAEH